jgi:CheY-like chemotaxis protein
MSGGITRNVTGQAAPGCVSPDTPTSLRILLVDDDAMIGLLLSEMLEDMGHTICGIEANETAAVAAAAWHHPDLMIVDARLGHGSGVDAMARILQSGFIPHLYMTGNIAWVLARAPTAIVLQKPFGEADLRRGILRAHSPMAGI